MSTFVGNAIAVSGDTINSMMLRMSVLKEAANCSSTSPCYAADDDVPGSGHLHARERLSVRRPAEVEGCKQSWLPAEEPKIQQQGGREHHQSKPEP